jgi:baculoviral IAP repeat-containing protein 6
MNDINKFPNVSYHSLESILIKLASLCDIKDEYEPLDTEEYKKVLGVSTAPVQQQSQKQTANTVWKAGTGYGHSGLQNWDPNEYVRLQKEKDQQIQSVINTIIDNMSNFKESEMQTVYKILDSSYLIPFIKSYIKGTNILEMSKHTDMYKLLFTFMQLLATDESIFLFDTKKENTSLYDLLFELYKEAQTVIKIAKGNNDPGDNDIPTMLCVVYEMIQPIHNAYIENVKKNMESRNQDWANKLEQMTTNEDPKNVEYKKVMEELLFEMCNFKVFKYQTSGECNKQTKSRLAREFGGFAKSLPISYGSSIFVKVSEKDIRMIKVLITGPDDTPYDSGCLIFDVYTGNDYPTTNPQMIFLNHGGKRFNPNLYNCGKVCLSLLGTWGGEGGEKWNSSTSTLQQLFISVQSQILIPNPFFNEPSHESRYNNVNGKKESQNYNNERRYYTMCHAMYDLLVNPNAYPEFSEIIKNHFKLKKDYILALFDKWVSEPNNNFAKETKETADKIKIELDKLT